MASHLGVAWCTNFTFIGAARNAADFFVAIFKVLLCNFAQIFAEQPAAGELFWNFYSFGNLKLNFRMNFKLNFQFEVQKLNSILNLVDIWI